MPSYSLVLDRASVVLLGRFNPPIFHPAWLARHSLIRDAEAAHVEGLIVSDELTKFKVDWLDIQVTSDRFQALTDEVAHAAPLRDLVVSIFGLLEHTHFWALGMNRHLHYEVDSEERWHRYGHFLAPKEPWEGLIAQPGMRSLTMQGSRQDAPGARIQFVVEPSRRAYPGVYFALNEHHERRKHHDSTDSKQELSDADTRRELIEILTKGWEGAQNYARKVAESLLERG
jgi:hypothetical protein